MENTVTISMEEYHLLLETYYSHDLLKRIIESTDDRYLDAATYITIKMVLGIEVKKGESDQ